MASIPRDFVAELGSRINIVDVISPYVSLKKAGKEYKACCPFHKEKSPSFTVSVEKNFYHCFGCQKNGDAIQFLMDYNKMSYVEAITDLAKQVGMTVPMQEDSRPRENLQPLYDVNELAAKFYQQQLQYHPEAAHAQQYLKRRGLNHDIIQRYGIGYAPSGWENLLNHATGHQFSVEHCIKAGLVINKTEGKKCYDRFRHRIMFPIRDNRGRVIAFGGRAISDQDTPKYLNSPETPLFHKGHELYGLWEAGKQHNAKGIILVEGYMDVVALAQYGFDSAVATLGTACSREHLQKCFRYNKQLYFCFDGDAAGTKAAWRACEIALGLLKDGKSVRFLFLPNGEDPDSFIRKIGADGFKAKCEHATSLADFFFDYLQKDLDLKELDQKAQLANRAAPLLQQIPDAILKELMFTTLSQLVQLPLGVLKEIQTGNHDVSHHFQTTTPTSAAASTAKVSTWRQSGIQKLPSPMRVVISLLVQNPTLIEHTPDVTMLSESPLPGAALLMALLAFIREQRPSDTRHLLTMWADLQSKQHLEKCAEYSHCIPAQGIAAEYQGAVARLIEHHQRTLVEQYMQKAQQTGLTEPEKRELHRLLGCLSNNETKTKQD